MSNIHCVVDVVILKKCNLNCLFSYLILKKSNICIGSCVKVPFGYSNKIVYGIVVSRVIHNNKTIISALKSIVEIVNIPNIPESLIILGEWIANYYCCPISRVFSSIMPNKIMNNYFDSVFYVSIKNINSVGDYIFFNNNNNDKILLKKKQKIIEFLLKNGEIPVTQLKKYTGSNNALIESMIADEIILKRHKSDNIKKDSITYDICQEKKYKLTQEQKRSIKYTQNVIDNHYNNNNKYDPVILVFGTTGSGKTEIYINLIRSMIKKKKSVILLVPEITLILHMADNIKARINEELLILHHKLSNMRFSKEWIKICNSQFSIIIGTRSVLFAPCRNLGLIIIDEEHDTSYKQNIVPKYCTKNVAIKRANIESAIIMLGSATPSIETYYHVICNKYYLTELKNRTKNNIMPIINVIDMKQQHNNVLSKELLSSIFCRLQKSEQIILYLNRRGYSTYLYCKHCGHVMQCEKCSTNYIYHKNGKYLSCHLCGQIVNSNLDKCSSCGLLSMRYSGIGTEHIEEIISKRFPCARIQRIDSDIIVNHKMFVDIVNGFKSGKIDILIGTQMITKGFDFPNVTLVGIINADLGLHIPSFRSAERVFQTIVQVSGRAGRGGVDGEVCLQTIVPFNSTIQHAVNQDYKSFFINEIKLRKKFYYPPISNFLTLEISNKIKSRCYEVYYDIYSKINIYFNRCQDIIISPIDAFYTVKINNIFKLYISIRGKIDSNVKAVLMRIIKKYNKIVAINIDA